jgi:hypothetical protein
MILCMSGILRFTAVAELTEIAGDLPAVVTAEKSPYLVTADIFVPAGKAVRFEPGVIFLFNNFTGLHIQGVLTAKGTKEKPVIFTSSNDKQYNPEATLNPTPYDWNGIYLQKDALGTGIEHFTVIYSVKGIVAETKYISLSHGIFRENGRSHCVIEGTEMEVEEGKPFSHSVSIKDAKIDGVPIQVLHDSQAFKRNLLRYGSVTVMIGGMAAGGFFGNELRKSYKSYSKLQSKDLSNTTWNGTDDLTRAEDRFVRHRTGTVISAVVALIGSAGFYWSFTF